MSEWDWQIEAESGLHELVVLGGGEDDLDRLAASDDEVGIEVAGAEIEFKVGCALSVGCLGESDLGGTRQKK